MLQSQTYNVLKTTECFNMKQHYFNVISPMHKYNIQKYCTTLVCCQTNYATTNDKCCIL